MEEWTAAVQQAAQCLEEKPSRSLLSAISEIAEWTLYYENKHQSSSTQSNYRDWITELRNAADVLANALDRSKTSVRTVTDQEVDEAVDTVVCVSACNFDPLSWGIGVQN